MVGFDHDFSNKLILIGAFTTAIDLPNGSDSAHLDDSALFQGDDNYLLSTSQDHDFGISVYEAAKNRSGNQHIDDRYQVVLTKLNKALIDIYLVYVPIYEPFQ